MRFVPAILIAACPLAFAACSSSSARQAQLAASQATAASQARLAASQATTASQARLAASQAIAATHPRASNAPTTPTPLLNNPKLQYTRAYPGVTYYRAR